MPAEVAVVHRIDPGAGPVCITRRLSDEAT
jgi:hypothetical protein